MSNNFLEIQENINKETIENGIFNIKGKTLAASNLVDGENVIVGNSGKIISSPITNLDIETIKINNTTGNSNIIFDDLQLSNSSKFVVENLRDPTLGNRYTSLSFDDDGPGFGLNIRLGGVIGVQKLPNFEMDINGICNVDNSFYVNGTNVLNSNTLGTGIINSSLTNLGTLTSLNMNGTITGKDIDIGLTNNYKVNGLDVLNTNTLGPGVVNSNLENVGVLTDLTILGDVQIGGTVLKVDTITNRVMINQVSASYHLDISCNDNDGIRLNTPSGIVNPTLWYQTPSYRSSIRLKQDDGSLQFWSENATNTAFKFFNASTTEVFTIRNAGCVGINNPSSAKPLDIISTLGGLVPPRMTTTERDSITGTLAGEIIYNNTLNKLQCYNGTIWNNLF